MIYGAIGGAVMTKWTKKNIADDIYIFIMFAVCLATGVGLWFS